MAYSAMQVANAFIRRQIPDLTPMKLQKLMFLAQSWYLKNHEVFPYSMEIVQEKKYKISVKQANDLYVKYL